MRLRLKEAIIGAALGVAMFSQAELVGHWAFDDGGGTTAVDSSGNGFDGSMPNGAVWTNGYEGGALYFDGTGSSVVSIGLEAMQSISNAITISFWSYGHESHPTQQNAFCGYVGNSRKVHSHFPWGNENVTEGDDGGQTIFFDANSGSQRDRINASATDPEDLAKLYGNWSHWIFTKDADTGEMAIYCNGTQWLYGTGKNQTMAGLTGFFIGSEMNRYYYHGILDEFKIYNHALSAEEIDPTILVAQIEKSEQAGESPFEVIFDGTSSISGQGIAEYLWDFGADPSNMVVDATGAVVTNTFTDVEVRTITLYVIDNAGVTNSATTDIEVLPAGDAAEQIDIVAVQGEIPWDISSEAFYGSDIAFLLTDTFGYHPNFPTNFSPALAHSDGFHGNNTGALDVLLSFTNSTPYTTIAANPVVVMDVWGRDYDNAKIRDDDFDVILYNGSWDEGDIVAESFGNGVDDASNYTRVTINFLPVGTTFDRVRIVGHKTALSRPNNEFTLTEVRLSAINGELTTAVAKVSADPVSGYYPLEVTFDGSESYAVEGTITGYSWEFGDGNSASGADSAMHTYLEPGNYTAVLTVVNSVGDSNTADVVISASNPIIPAIAMSTNAAYYGIDIGFDGSGSTNEVADALTTYAWDFGDGNVASGMMVTHAFAVPGTNTVTLTVGDDAGRTNSTTAVVYTLDSWELTLTGSTLSWDTPAVEEFVVQYTDNLVTDIWDTYTTVTSTPPTTSVELPLGRTDVECYRVGIE